MAKTIPFMTETQSTNTSEMRLYDRQKRRLYMNAAEREQFLMAAMRAAPEVRTLCLTLFYTGSRISEALELSPPSVQVSARTITFRTLKKRKKLVMREVPIPKLLAEDLAQTFDLATSSDATAPLWRQGDKRLTRGQAYRFIKARMREADIEGAQACPKGLRHGYGVHAIRSGVQLNMLSKWMGHASLTTTAIYATAIGREELEIADRMWDE